MPERKYGRRLLRGSLLNMIAVVFNQGSTLAANIFVVHLLTQKMFGEYAIIQMTLLTIATISQLSTGYTASKFIAQFRGSDPGRAGRIMGACARLSAIMAVVSALLLVPCAPLLATSVLSSPHLGEALILGSGFVLFSTINGYQMGALTGLEAFGSLAKAGVASGLVAVIAVVFGAWLGQLNGAIVGLGIGALFRCVFHFGYLQAEAAANGLSPQYTGAISQERSIIFSFALPATLAGLYSLPMIWIANAILFRHQDGHREMALYAAASSIRLLTLFIPQVTNSVSLSILNNARSGTDPSKYASIYRSNIAIISGVAIVGTATVGLFGDHVLGIFGSDFTDAVPTLQILMISCVFEGIALAVYQHIQSCGRIWLSFFAITVPRELLFVVMAWILVPTYGAFGLGLAYTIGCLLALLIMCALVSYERRTDIAAPIQAVK